MKTKAVAKVVLTETQEAELRECVAVVKRNKRSFEEVAEALFKIRDHKLYRRDAKTFSEYCEQEFGFTRQRAHQLMSGASTLGDMSKNLTFQPKASHATELAKAPPEKREAVVREVERSAPKDDAGKPKPTAATFREAVAKVAPSNGAATVKEKAIADLHRLNDVPPEPEMQDGARVLAREIAAALYCTVRVAFLPTLRFKDARAWVNAGATRAEFDAWLDGKRRAVA